MSDIEKILKAEITRLARKEVRLQLEPYKAAAAQSKAHIVALRSEVHSLKAQLRALGKQTRTVVNAVSVEPKGVSKQRFTAKGFATTRHRLAISCEQMGTLLGVSGQSVRKWEEGNATPREKYHAAIFALRSVGKREIATKLQNA